MKATPIEQAYKEADKLLTITGIQYGIHEVDLALLKGEVNALMVKVHNAVVNEMRENLLPEINKLYERHGYKK